MASKQRKLAMRAYTACLLAVKMPKLPSHE